MLSTISIGNLFFPKIEYTTDNAAMIAIVGYLKYKEKNFTGRTYCEEKGIEIYYNSRDHRFSSSGLRKQVKELEKKNWKKLQLLVVEY